MLTGSQIRRKFLDFFVQKGHKEVHSSSLVPANDPTLLFTNAGMNQFKDVFLGLEKRDYSRATSSQKCVRAGGKHNDLENVGFTNRHHTFFEMLGNFSFGDYFKKDAIAYAWELITSPKWFGIPVQKLTFTACGEIHYDMGPAASDKGHTDCKFGCECGRYVEIWNLVFMQFNRDASGTVEPLPKPSIDTGAGLERLAAVLQGKISNFDTDLFVPLVKRAGELTAVRPGTSPRSDASLRIIADHARASTFLISDGVVPSNEGRGYVLRKIMRRGIRHGRLLGSTEPFMAEMSRAVHAAMRDAFPELDDSIDRVSKI